MRFFCRPDLIDSPVGACVPEESFGPPYSSIALADTVQFSFTETDQVNAMTQRGIFLRRSQAMKSLVDTLRRILWRRALDVSHRYMLITIATKKEAETAKDMIFRTRYFLVEVID